MSKQQYEVTPGHSILVGNHLLKGSETRPAIVPLERFEKGEFDRKIANGVIRPVGGQAVDVKKQLLLHPHTIDHNKPDEKPIQITSTDKDGVRTERLPAANTKPSQWILDPDTLRDKPLDELRAMILDRAEGDKEIETFSEDADLNEEAAIDWLSQDFAKTSPELRQKQPADMKLV